MQVKMISLVTEVNSEKIANPFRWSFVQVRIDRPLRQGSNLSTAKVALSDITGVCNISRPLADLLASRIRWRQDSEVRDCVARLIIRLFEVPAAI